MTRVRVLCDFICATNIILGAKQAAHAGERGGFLSQAELEVLEQSCLRGDTPERFCAQLLVSRHEQQILAEAAIAESRVMLEATPATKHQSFFATLHQLREAFRCPTCGKSRAVMNVAPRGFRAEKVTPDTHCHCPDSPIVKAQAAGALNPLEPVGV